MPPLTPRDREALSSVVSALPVPATQVEAALRAAHLIGATLLTENDRAVVRSRWDAMFTPEPAKGPKRTTDERIVAALESIATTLAISALAEPDDEMVA